MRWKLKEHKLKVPHLRFTQTRLCEGGEPRAGKLALVVRWGAVGNTGYAVRWPPTQLQHFRQKRKGRQARDGKHETVPGKAYAPESQ
jgi:hypothetical protein